MCKISVEHGSDASQPSRPPWSASAPQDMGVRSRELSSQPVPIDGDGRRLTGLAPDASDPAVASGQQALRACIWSRLLNLVLRSPVRTIL